MKLHIFIKDEFDHVLLDKEVKLELTFIKGKEYYEIPDNFSLNEQIDIAKDILYDRKGAWKPAY